MKWCNQETGAISDELFLVLTRLFVDGEISGNDYVAVTGSNSCEFKVQVLADILRTLRARGRHDLVEQIVKHLA